MKLSSNTKSFLKRSRDIVSSLGAAFTIVSVLMQYSHKLFEIAFQLMSIVLDPFFPDLPANYQIINLAAWITILILVAVSIFGMFHLFRWGLDKFITNFMNSLLKDLDEALSEKIEKALDTKIEHKLEELQPPPPPHGVTDEPCLKSGTYRVQDESLGVFVRTFRKGQIFPGVLVDRSANENSLFWGGQPGKKPVPVTWIYQIPQ